ncbi:MAG: IspD/TarI family cytidylyltransferase, partial [Candidatus Omnitrophica bacterium]|nr:IspD/TarI family cytidylyltransferase [Candidatus Omnitrophota bacterium]
MRIGVIIVAAGLGRRMGKGDKSIISLSGKPLFFYAVNTFLKVASIKEVVLVLRKKNFPLAKKLFFGSKVVFVKGGKERADSVSCGLAALSLKITHVLIHDAARPFVDSSIIKAVIAGLSFSPAVICAVKAKDALKVVDKKGFIEKTLNRDSIIAVHTPQGFEKKLLVESYKKVKTKKVFD